jgi:putative effector of murein hydrolase LrgA (UPF0299 family)
MGIFFIPRILEVIVKRSSSVSESHKICTVIVIAWITALSLVTIQSGDDGGVRREPLTP